jgi:hypothetical protein
MNYLKLKEVQEGLVLQIKHMKIQKVCIIVNKEFGIGVFIKKGTITASYNYYTYIKVLWFELGFKFCYGNKSE